jgi:N-hydroxyarylamine O-acetyltransferase
MDIHAYLDRIGYPGTLEPNATTLDALQRAHLLAVPFENLDIHLGRPIVLDQTALFDKIVARRRGGFCYELNGLFAVLLRELGFEVTLLAAGVARASGGFGPDYDHLTLLVECPLSAVDTPLQEAADGGQPTTDNQQPTTWLVDVGFGDSFRAPLRLIAGLEQPQDGRAYRLDRDGEQWTLWERAEEEWQPQYRFTLQPRAFAEYTGMCQYHQSSPESSFTRKRVCSLATPDGRLTLSDLQLIITSNGQRAERQLRDEDEFRAVLRERFGIDLS